MELIVSAPLLGQTLGGLGPLLASQLSSPETLRRRRSLVQRHGADLALDLGPLQLLEPSRPVAREHDGGRPRACALAPDHLDGEASVGGCLHERVERTLPLLEAIVAPADQ